MLKSMSHLVLRIVCIIKKFDVYRSGWSCICGIFDCNRFPFQWRTEVSSLAPIAAASFLWNGVEQTTKFKIFCFKKLT